ncbi:helix-turn-helix domain-containing protein [Spirosoma endophyticum]|uniref:DNA-binding transcriptional regulator, XRE family n=1 Tax=Spirosoma endophyticum TaxID=662367 RepID=A0A1I1FKE7_9BACT|nr:helix-turn-helix transcriptional regulator [Spirosoma endophyticum]SFB99805.1 DNA-binding transcriptional regulator, XRE family [Spirosoma endophyticum]
MAYQLDADRLATLLRAKRAGRGLRDIADEIGEVSPSTLSRVENGKAPDLTTFLLICDWLQVAPDELLRKEEDTTGKEINPLEEVALLLRSNKNLDAATAKTLATVIKAAYQSLTGNPNTPESN